MLKKISLFFLFFFTIILSGCSDLFKEPPDHIEYDNPSWTSSGNIIFYKSTWSNKEGEDGDTIHNGYIITINPILKEENILINLPKRSTPKIQSGVEESQFFIYERNYNEGNPINIYLNTETGSEFVTIDEEIKYVDYSPSGDYLVVETESGVKLYNKQFEKQKELTNITNLSGWKYADEIIGTAEIDSGKVLRYITKENEIVKEILISSNVQVLQYYPDGKRVLCQLDEKPIDGKIRFMKINKQEEKECFAVDFAENTVLNVQLNPTNSEQILFSLESSTIYAFDEIFAIFPSGIAIINTDGTGKEILRQRETINK